MFFRSLAAAFAAFCALSPFASAQRVVMEIPYNPYGNSVVTWSSAYSSSGVTGYPQGMWVQRGTQLCLSLKFGNTGDPATDTTDWACTSTSTPGATGATGSTGPQGLTGATGPQGATGPAGSGNGSSVTLQHNGTANSSQTQLNLVQGANVTITDSGSGNLTINSTAASGSAAGGFPTKAVATLHTYGDSIPEGYHTPSPFDEQLLLPAYTGHGDPAGERSHSG